MKKILIFSLLCFLILNLSGVAYAKNFDSPPQSTDIIKDGDTYHKGIGELKVFDKDGNLINKINKLENVFSPLSDDSHFDNGNYGGSTDIWWYYDSTIITGSGPKGEAVTYSYPTDGESDYLQAYIELFVNGDKKDSESGVIVDDNEVTAYVEHLYYAIHGGILFKCRGETAHKVIDSDMGWDASFDTVDEF